MKTVRWIKKLYTSTPFQIRSKTLQNELVEKIQQKNNNKNNKKKKNINGITVVLRIAFTNNYY